MSVLIPRTPHKVKPGQKCPDSGIYQAFYAFQSGSKPVTTDMGLLRVTMVRGRRMPPIPSHGGYWLQVKDTQVNDPSSRSNE